MRTQGGLAMRTQGGYSGVPREATAEYPGRLYRAIYPGRLYRAIYHLPIPHPGYTTSRLPPALVHAAVVQEHGKDTLRRAVSELLLTVNVSYRPDILPVSPSFRH